MNKIQSVSEITTYDGRRTLIVRLARSAKASFINGAFYLDEPTVEDYRTLKHAGERAVMGPSDTRNGCWGQTEGCPVPASCATAKTLSRR